MAPSNSQSWKADLWLRMRRHFLLKLAGVSTFTWLFFLAYFELLRHPARAVTTMPLTPLDRWIAFQPSTLVAYLSLWFYVGIAPGLQLTFVELVVYGLWVGALCITGLSIFYAWPTEVPALTLDVSHLPGFVMLQGVDASGNACPSMHVAVAIFSAVWLDHLFRETRAPNAFRAANAVWFGAIVYSTLAIKQHVVLDALAGAALGLAFAWPSLRWRPLRRRPAASPIGADIMGHH